MHFHIGTDCRQLYPHGAVNNTHMKMPLVA